MNSRQSSQSFSFKTSKFNFSKLLSSFIFTRLAINSAKDTGYMNSYKYFQMLRIKILLGGMFISKYSMQHIYHLRSHTLFLIEKYLVPDLISFLPSNHEYLYSDKYEELSTKYDLEIMSIDNKNALLCTLA